MFYCGGQIGCPINLSSECVFYTGPNLIKMGVTTNTSLENILLHIESLWDSLIGGGGGGGGGHVIMNSGTPLPQRPNLNFTNGLNAYDEILLNRTTVALGGTISSAVLFTGSDSINFYNASQRFLSLRIRNTNNTFEYVVTPSAITANINITLPLLNANDTFVFQNFQQTIANKTLGANTSIAIGSDATGDLYTNVSGLMTRIPAVVVGNVLLSQGVGQVPAWGKVTSAHVDGSIVVSGQAWMLANGGTLTGNNVINGSFSLTFSNTEQIFYALKFRDSSDQYNYSVVTSSLSSDVNIVLPQLQNNDVFVFQNHSQTITNKILGANTGVSIGSDATGDIYYRNALGLLTRLPDVAVGNVLLSGGVNQPPSYGKVTSAHVDSSIQLSGLSWLLASGGTLTGDNTISGGFNVGFTNTAVAVGSAPGSIPSNTKFLVKGFSNGSDNIVLFVDDGDNNKFAVTGAGRVFIYTNPDDAATGHQLLLRNNTSGVITKLGIGNGLSIAGSNLEVASGYAWLLASGGTLTGTNTITMNSPNMLNFTGTWTATASNQYAASFGGNFTAMNSANAAVIGYRFNPTVSGNPGNFQDQVGFGVLINPTFVVGGNTVYSNTALRIAPVFSASTGSTYCAYLDMVDPNTGNIAFRFTKPQGFPALNNNILEIKDGGGSISAYLHISSTYFDVGCNTTFNIYSLVTGNTGTVNISAGASPPVGITIRRLSNLSHLEGHGVNINAWDPNVIPNSAATQLPSVHLLFVTRTWTGTTDAIRRWWMRADVSTTINDLTFLDIGFMGSRYIRIRQNGSMLLHTSGDPDSAVKFDIRGLGTTSATSALRVADLSNNELLRSFDDGEWIFKNPSGTMLMRILPTNIVEVGGTSSIIRVPSTIPSGAARLEFRDNILLAYILGTSSSNFLEFRSTTNDHRITLRKTYYFDSNQSTVVHINYEAVVPNTAGATTTIASFPVVIGTQVNVESSWMISASDGNGGGAHVTGTIKNVGGNTTMVGSQSKQFRFDIGNPSVDIVANNTNDTIDFNFTNASAPNNRAYKVNISVRLHITDLAT